MRSRKYAVLLTLLVVSLVLQSFDARGGAAAVLSDIFRTVLGVAIFFVVFERPRERAGVAAILVLTIAIGWGRHLSAGLDETLSLALHALISLFLWAAIWVILRDLFRKPAVGAENVLGAICGYLLAGDAWAGVNAVTYLLAPAAYGINPEVSALLVEWHGRTALFSYYSLAQMLTIGYADVTPLRAPATTLSLFGALFGLFYTAVVVSQFVGMTQSRRNETP
ncbi:MAG TPA: ion channel [Casimicrobiaceae bacterium]|nr:ion channel [Casimicrobiaceae bacterium]